MKKLHPTQEKILELLKSNSLELFTIRELQEELGLSSPSVVFHHIQQLERKGYIRRRGGSGQIEVLPKPIGNIIYLNLYGMVKCGPDGFLNNDNVIDIIPFPAKQLRVNPDSFLVEAHGDSMEPLIHNKDLVLVEKTSAIDNGDTAVVVYKDGAILKKIYKEKKHIILQSLNPKYEPIVINPDEANPVGIVRGVVRSFPEKNLKIKKNRI